MFRILFEQRHVGKHALTVFSNMPLLRFDKEQKHRLLLLINTCILAHM
jgi:hypothetical protein